MRAAKWEKWVETLLEQWMVCSSFPLVSNSLSCCSCIIISHSPAESNPALDPNIPRHLLQLHHDDGGEQRGVDGGGAQLPPQDRGDPRDADVGPQCISPVASVDSSDGPTGKINIPIK